MDKITDTNIQLFTITMEECGELIQACSKVMRRGADEKSINDLSDECGDVLCMLELLKEHGYITQEDLDKRVLYKREKLKSWSNL